MKSLILITLFVFSLNCFADSGVLILAHGSMSGGHANEVCHNNHPSNWEKEVLKTVQSIEAKLNQPVEVAFGMWNTDCFNAGIKRLKLKMQNKLDHLYVLPLFISSYSAVIEMQKFMFHKRADRVIPLPSVQKVNFNHKITYLKAMDYHPQISFVLANNVHRLIHEAKEDGFKKDQMQVILVMHGPVGDKDNKKWLEMGKHYLKDVTYLFKTAAYHQVSLRDDAAADTRDAATKRLRTLVQKTTNQGHRALILPLLLSKGGIEQGILQRLQGLEYTWEGKMLLPDSKLEDYLIQRINNL